MFAGASFVLHDVTIGRNFHWERQERQTFAGALKITVGKGRLTAVNVIGAEDYLLSVISSEMSSSASGEFLKAHAVISRSWVMARISAARGKSVPVMPEGIVDMPSVISHAYSVINAEASEGCSGEREYVKWYDHEEHDSFDVCADDHCQRYQGLARVTGDTVRKAIDSTWGQVLVYGGELCDARFSKCCGGRMERFSTCWEDVDYPYLQPLCDSPGHVDGERCFCDTDDEAVLSQVLNGYDRETPDFFRWREEYGRDELASLVSERSGVNIGELVSMEAIVRGESGRIKKLKITGTECTLTVGKELEIRRLLSRSHLKSSAFDVTFEGDKVIIDGRGWGHGVGLCQIGAAVMASRGYGYREILGHYYPGAELSGERIS